MSSTYTFYPPGPDPTTTHRDRLQQPRIGIAHDAQHNQAYHGHLSPFSPQLASSSSASPALNTNTPAESVSTLSVHYQSSEYSEGDDPFFGVNFNTAEGASPSFLDDDILQFDTNGLLINNFAGTQHVPHQTLPYAPLSPDKSPSLPTGSPNGQTGDDTAAPSLFTQLSRTSVAPHELSLTHESSSVPLSNISDPQLTPRTETSISPSDEDLAPVTTMQSPRVTISHWDRDDVGGIHPPTTQHVGYDESAFSAARDDTGRWIPDLSTGQRGLDPSARSDVQVDSINDLAAQRKLSDSNKEVDGWLKRTAPPSPFDAQPSEQTADLPDDGPDNIPLKEISMGDQTENKLVPGQTYYTETGGNLTREDLELMRQGRNWDNAPVPFSISPGAATAYQPPTSNDAMQKYQRLCQDNDSIVSRAATWGTRRLSLPSILDAEVQLAGNLLKKFSLSKGDIRRPSILEGLRGLVRRPSVNASKRSRADPDDASSSPTESLERKEMQTKLAPPSPKPGWPRKQSVPSINTAVFEVGSAVASIGAAHARTGSISATPITSPRSPSGRSLSVKRPLNRLRRSKSETSGIVDLWKKSGGPPVSNLAGQRVNAPEADDDEDEEDDLYEDGDMRAESDQLIDDVEPNFQGFQQHLLKLNPFLATTNNYLVDRIAHAQVSRYKALCQGRIKHLQAVNAKNCASGSMCVALGGSANILDPKGDQRGLDPLSARYEGSDGDATPLEGAINPDSFPQDIPMPPTGSLPAEFECQLCFAAKKFNKPSDWTKHVHEDVQPFTCTWDRCKDHKMFKRKADWVRHENEGHRHLEWWTCDVDDCRHRCYRRDNFLQHLVREHKFIEPKVKTKAAIKRAGGVDPTWVKVEQCHQETPQLPQQEPCRFCGKIFPTWKKLTVHLAKHMEHISLPVLKLVAKKELDEDTIISPVQDPPPRTFPPTFSRQEQHMFGPSPTIPQGPMPHQPGPALAYPSHAPHQPQPLGMYPLAPPQGYPSNLFNSGYDDLTTTHGMAQPPQLAMPSLLHQPHHNFQSLNTQASAFPTLPVTSAAAAAPSGYMSMAPDVEPFPALSMDPLGLGLQDAAAAAAQMGYDSSRQQHGLPVVAPEHHYQPQQHQQGRQQMGQGDGQQGQGQHHHRQFSPQGSVSPYGHSPNPSLSGLPLPQGGGGAFY